jgi:LacI family transcriptional regulator
MATLQEIAEKAGVSSVTVSNVLNHRNKETWPSAKARAERIRQIARRMGYRPHSAARAMGRGRFSRVGMILPFNRSSYIPHRFISGLTHALAAHDYQLAIDEMPPPRARKASLPQLLTEMSLDGLINFAPELDEVTRKTLAKVGLPAIWINDKRPVNAVYPDELDGAKRLTRHLLACGHRRISFVYVIPRWVLTYESAETIEPSALRAIRPTAERTKRSSHYSNDDREQGYCKAMAEAGLSADIQRIYGQDAREHVAALKQYLQSADRPSALILLDEPSMLTAIRAADALDLGIPEDLSVATFSWGGPWRAEFGLSCMRYYAPDVAKLAAEMLMSLIREPQVDQSAIAYTGHLLLDQTVQTRKSE